jgi:hypothetical protein
VALAGKRPNVILEGLALLLSATLHIPGVARPYIRAMKHAGVNLREILPAINQVPRQVVEPSPSRVSQVNGEKLDDEKVIIYPTYPTCKVVILQPHALVCFAVIILDDCHTRFSCAKTKYSSYA